MSLTTRNPASFASFRTRPVPRFPVLSAGGRASNLQQVWSAPGSSSTAGLGHIQQRKSRSGSGLQPMSAAAGASSGRAGKSSSNKRPATELDVATAERRGHGETGPTVPVPLKYVVQEAVKRWFEDTMQEAQRGSVKEMALVGQMYMEGYGVKQDSRAAKEWTDKANARGYRMQGVYCDL